MAKFKQAILDIMKTDPALYITVAQKLGCQPGSLPTILKRNGKTLNQHSIVMIVAKHLNQEPEELLEDEESEVKVAQS